LAGGENSARGLGFGLGLALLAGLFVPSPAAADCGPAVLERARLERLAPEGDLLLSDGRRLRLAGLHLAQPKPELLPQPGAALAVGLLDERPDRWGRLPAIVFALSEGAPPVWLQQRLLQGGAALARPEPGLGGCWPLLGRLEAEAGAALPATPPEAGRFARVAGRISRVGEGRGAHFITLYEPGGARLTGLVRKAHLARFRQAGVDVPALRGHVIRLRGVRSATNPALIPLTAAEQIEIVR
jgi:hypothetical protein